MAQKVNIVLVDDIDESEATETVTFGLDGASFEIDLNDAHAAELRDALAPYIGHGRKASRRGGRRATTARRSATSGPSPSEMREWGRANGWQVSDRGRVSGELREAYEAAN